MAVNMLSAVGKAALNSRTEISAKDTARLCETFLSAYRVDDTLAAEVKVRLKDSRDLMAHEAAEDEKRADALREQEEARQRQKTEEEMRVRAAMVARAERIGKRCGSDIISQANFVLGKNPYADQNRCVEFVASTFQMVSANEGIFNMGNNELVFIRFRDVFRGPAVKGVALVVGFHDYITRQRVSNRIPKLEMVEIYEIPGHEYLR